MALDVTNEINALARRNFQGNAQLAILYKLTASSDLRLVAKAAGGILLIADTEITRSRPQTRTTNPMPKCCVKLTKELKTCNNEERSERSRAQEAATHNGAGHKKQQSTANSEWSLATRSSKTQRRFSKGNAERASVQEGRSTAPASRAILSAAFARLEARCSRSRLQPRGTSTQ